MYKLLGITTFVTLLALGYSMDNQCPTNLIKEETNQTCASVYVNVTLTVTYPSENGENITKRFQIPCDMLSLDDDNNVVNLCGVNTTDVNQTVVNLRSVEHSQDFLFTFYFLATINPGNQKWNLTNLTITFPLNEDNFPGTNSSGEVTAVTKDLFDSSIDYQRSYMCNSNRTFNQIATDNNNITVSISVADFRVQAFQFSDNNEFGNAFRCGADIKGSKIVPIAVGAALAGLVIIVLIAYIIGRLRSRRQSSYEALS